VNNEYDVPAGLGPAAVAASTQGGMLAGFIASLALALLTLLDLRR
jgi:hypothetical protein